MSVTLLLLLCLAADDPAPKKPVTDDYHGVKVVDDYRWLEASGDPEVRQWSDRQNTRTRAYLDHLSRAEIVQSLKRLYTGQSVSFSSLTYRGATLFAIETQPPKLQPFLVTLASPDDPASARPIVDPNAIDPAGSATIDFYVPSLDGKLVAVSLSKNGSEDGDLAVFETATGNRLPDSIPRVNRATAGGSVAWNADSSGFWYTRYPRPGERAEADLNFYQQIWFHHLGGAQDEYALGKEFPRIAEITLQSAGDGKLILARVANGDGGEYLHYLLTAEGRWREILRISDQVSEAAFSPSGTIFALSNKSASNGTIFELFAPKYASNDLKISVTPGRSAIDGFLPAPGHLYIRYMAGGPSKLIDKPGGPIDIPPISSVNQLVRNGDALLLVLSYKSAQDFSATRISLSIRPPPQCARAIREMPRPSAPLPTRAAILTTAIATRNTLPSLFAIRPPPVPHGIAAGSPFCWPPPPRPDRRHLPDRAGGAAWDPSLRSFPSRRSVRILPSCINSSSRPRRNG